MNEDRYHSINVVRTVKRDLTRLCVSSSVFLASANFLEGQWKDQDSSLEAYVCAGLIALTGLVMYAGGRYVESRMKEALN